MSNKLTRITKDFRRVVTIDGRQCVLTLGRHGMTIRRLKSRVETAVPLRWQDLAKVACWTKPNWRIVRCCVEWSEV
jgi:hypothetical protein